jgi:hypothetical protein
LTAQNGPERPRSGALEPGLERILAGLEKVRRTAWRALRNESLTIVTVVGLVGAALLVLSTFLDVVRFVDLSGQLIPGAEATRKGTAAMAVIGVVAGLAVLLARWAAHSLPAVAAAALGAIALAITLIADLPDVTSSGITEGKLIGQADPGPGFWVELAGGLITLVAGLVLARLLAPRKTRPANISRPRPRPRSG